MSYFLSYSYNELFTVGIKYTLISHNDEKQICTRNTRLLSTYYTLISHNGEKKQTKILSVRCKKNGRTVCFDILFATMM